jgi:hypothetical protein
MVTLIIIMVLATQSYQKLQEQALLYKMRELKSSKNVYLKF